MTAPPDALRTLVDRYDAEALELAPGEARRVRLEVRGDDGAFDAVIGEGGARLQDAEGDRPDALLRADAATWRRIAADLRGGMDAFSSGRLVIRHNLHLGVGLLAATSGSREPGRLRFRRIETRWGVLSALEAGEGPPLVALHGLGGTKASFLPTVAALADRRRIIALDLPGFGDSDKPVGAYDAKFLARPIELALDALGLDRADVLGHSLGGRVAVELALDQPDRINRLVLMTPALAWLRPPGWAQWLRLLRPELGFLQPAPRPIVEAIVRRLIPGADRDGWAAVAADEFLRSYLDPHGRHAFYAAARNIPLDDPDRFWQRLRELSPDTLFLWGRKDPLVPIGFMRHVEEALPAARHVELDCGHIPQVERPREAHAAIARFLAGRPAAASRG